MAVRVQYGEVCLLLPMGLEGILQHVFRPGFVEDVPVVSWPLLLVHFEACGGRTGLGAGCIRLVVYSLVAAQLGSLLLLSGNAAVLLVSACFSAVLAR